MFNDIHSPVYRLEIDLPPELLAMTHYQLLTAFVKLIPVLAKIEITNYYPCLTHTHTHIVIWIMQALYCQRDKYAGGLIVHIS